LKLGAAADPTVGAAIGVGMLSADMRVDRSHGQQWPPDGRLTESFDG
jgi:hypothetical protein